MTPVEASVAFLVVSAVTVAAMRLWDVASRIRDAFAEVVA